MLVWNQFKEAFGLPNAQFSFCTVGMVDATWDDLENKNIWSFSLVWIDNVPKNGGYDYVGTMMAFGEMFKTSSFNIGFVAVAWVKGCFV